MVCRTHWNDVSDDKTTPENAILFVSTRDHKGNKGSGTRLLKRLTLVHCAWSLVVCNRKGPGVENGGEPPNASLETAEKDWFSNLWWLFKVNCLHSLSRESSCQTASFGTPTAVARVRRNRQRKIKLENFFHPLPPNSTYYHLSIVSAFPWNDCNYVKAENQSCSGFQSFKTQYPQILQIDLNTFPYCAFQNHTKAASTMAFFIAVDHN